jgi:predicted site-specific integrase-resolvase
MLTTAQVAERVGVAKVTVERWRFEGYGPHVYRFGIRGNIVRYDRSEVERFVAERRT